MVQQQSNEPKTYDKCRSCGSKETVAGSRVKKLQDEGRFSPRAKGCVSMVRTQIVDPINPVALVVPTITALMDICDVCGTYRCTWYMVTDEPLSPQGPGAGGPSGFPFKPNTS